MSEIDLIGAAQLALSNALAAFAIFATMIGAYLTVAYISGKSLTRTQLAIINFVFIVSMLSMTSAIYILTSIGFEYHDQAQLINHRLSFNPPSWIKYLNLVIHLSMMSGCLKFMWDLRKNQVDENISS